MSLPTVNESTKYLRQLDIRKYEIRWDACEEAGQWQCEACLSSLSGHGDCGKFLMTRKTQMPNLASAGQGRGFPVLREVMQ